MLPSNYLNAHLPGADGQASHGNDSASGSFGPRQATTGRSTQESLSEVFGLGDGAEQSRQLLNLQNKAIIANALLQRAVREGAGGGGNHLLNAEAERLLASNLLSGDLSARQHPLVASSLPPPPNLALSLHHRAMNQADTVTVLQQVMELEQRRRMDALLASNLLPGGSLQDGRLEAALRASSGTSLLSARDSVGNPSTLALEAERQRFLMEQALAQRHHHQSSLYSAAPSIMDVNASLHQSLPTSAAALSLRGDALLAGALGSSGSRVSNLAYSHLTRGPPTDRSPALGSRAISRDRVAAHHSDRSYQTDDSSEGNKKPAAKSSKKKVKSSDPRSSSDGPEHKYFPSERASLEISSDCTPADVSRILKVLGSTLRCKADPYVDVNALPEPLVIEDKRVFRGTDVFFPDTLFKMLEDAEREGWDDVIHWMPHGRSIRVSEKDRFVRDILPRYFSDQTKWSSFSRQLRLYGFARVSKGVDLDSYYHELFLKGRGELVRYMRRVGAPHGLDRRTFKLAEGEDPDFYEFPPLAPRSARKKSKQEKPSSGDEQQGQNVDGSSQSDEEVPRSPSRSEKDGKRNDSAEE